MQIYRHQLTKFAWKKNLGQKKIKRERKREVEREIERQV